MQNQAQRFIELLEEQQLLSPDILEELRRQIAESKTRLTTELLAKLLVDNGHLTKFQATKLIAQVKEPAVAEGNSQTPSQESELGLAEDDLTLADSGELDIEATPDNVAEVFFDEDEIHDVVEVSDADVVEVVDEDVQEVDFDHAFAQPLESFERQENVSDAFLTAPAPIKRTIGKPKSKANPYDSFRILGVGFLLALSLIAGFFLVNYFWRGSADERLKLADEAYGSRSYETAASMYREFSEVFPGNENASYARVRSAFATLRNDSENASDPQIGLQTALNVLPTVSGEPAMADQQNDLAGALISLATKFNARASNTEETAKRKVLMQDMDKLMELIEDPRYVGSNQRAQQEPTLNRISEDRNRILRDIVRDEDLVKALAAMDQKLDARDTLAAYQIRKDLVNTYPILEADPSLRQRVLNATRIEQTLVEPGSLEIRLTEQMPSQAAGRDFVLANRSGSTATSLNGQVIFVKVKGSVYGLDGGTGNILWRQYVGREFSNDPIRLGDTSSADALICQPEKGQLARIAGKTGDAVWFADLGEPAHRPTVEGDDLVVATFGGTIVALDAVTGQSKWITQLPQPAPVSPGAAFGKPNLYVPAEHSNLFVLSRVDGKCTEVYYLGHRAGAIVVPPILLLGQLFVFENINAATSKVHILNTSDDGLNLTAVQTPIIMDGNIVVPPQVDGRRLVVQSDVGQIRVLDIEPTAETQKVTDIASKPKDMFEPRLSWLIAESNRIWVADTRFTRFDLQVASGKLVRAWSENDGDRFVGLPQKFDDVIVHLRTVRDNQGIRVAAVEADMLNPIWETDLGSPVVLIDKSKTGFDVVNTSAMVFGLGNQPLRNEADANPGQGKPALLFTNPIRLANGNAVLFNQSRPNQLAIYTGSNSLKLVAANFGTSAPSSEAVAVGDNLAVGLDSGQLVLIDPNNGSHAASPYQPPMEAGKKVRWNAPAYLPQTQTLIVASDLQKMVRLSVGKELRALTEVALENPLRGPIVPVGNRVAAVETTSAGDSLKLFDAVSLVVGSSIPLTGRLVAGPYAVSGGCLLQADDELVFVSNEGKKLWSAVSWKSALVGPPLELDGNLIVTSVDGQVATLNAADGQVVSKVDAGQRLSSAPIMLPSALLVGGDEGVVLALPKPKQSSEAN